MPTNKQGNEHPITPGTVARMAGNIAAGLVTRDDYWAGGYLHIKDVANDALVIVQTILEMNEGKK